MNNIKKLPLLKGAPLNNNDRGALPAPTKPKKKSNVLLLVISLTLIGLGAGAFSYLGYQKLVVETQSETQVTEEVEELQEQYENTPVPEVTETPTTVAPVAEPVIEDTDNLTDTPIPAKVATYEDFGILYIPVLGDDYSALITAGDNSSEIYGGAAGVNYYPSAVMPAELGNFTLAGHRGYNGKGRFNNISTLNNGNTIYVETAEGWYKYSVTGQEIVEATQVEVLLPVPNQPEVAPTKSIITLTSCYYEGTVKKRIAVYGDLINFISRSEGKPLDI